MRGSRAVERAPEVGSLRLARAVMEQSRGNARGVIEELEGITFASQPGFAGADRAAFLLAQAYLQLGDAQSFSALARSVQSWIPATPYTRWIAVEQQFEFAATGADLAARTIPFTNDTTTTLGRDVAGATGIRLAAAALAAGNPGQAETLLLRVPIGSRFATRALHMRGIVAIGRGDGSRGIALLKSALVLDPAYAGRREVLLAVAAAALDQGRWVEAREIYDAADRDWRAQRDSLVSRRAAGDFDALWVDWESRPDSAGTLVLDGAALRAAAASATRAATDLRVRSIVEPPAPLAMAHVARSTVNVLAPTEERWNAVAMSAAAVASAREALSRSRRSAERESTSLADRRRYLGAGLDSLRRLDSRLRPGQAQLDSVRASLDALDAQLRHVRDEETRRVARRTAALLDACERQRAWVSGMHHIYVTGPDSTHWVMLRDGFPSAAGALTNERALLSSLEALAHTVARDAPGWLARSYEQAWGPHLMDRVVAQSAELRRDRVWARVLDRSIDSSRVAALTSEELAKNVRRALVLARRADSLSVANAMLRHSVAREAIDRTLAAIEREREGLDYGRAVSLHALAVRLDVADSSLTSAAVAPNGASSSAGAAMADDDHEDVESAALRAMAMPALQAFLDRHGRSPARGEMRFRLADLELVQARQEFRARMAEFLLRQGNGHAGGMTVPVLDPERTLLLYRRILAEDTTFAHLDAVRFNAGMILADAGEPEARHFFADLVALSPDSPYSQEAWLRMGDMAFDEKRFTDAVTLYARATGRDDPTLAVIANYKLGWAHFNQDHFEPAADAFRSVLDLYAARRADIHVDIEGEADAYFVHALAGAGGAEAFARYFDRMGGRPYDRRVLMALGQQFRHYGEFQEAAAVDRMVLARYPDAPEALIAAQRLIATHQRDDHQEQVRKAQAELAPRFAPGSPWYLHQSSDSLRTAGESFAHASWRALALAHHERARQSASREEWRAALGAYDILLKRWPNDPGAAVLQLDAGIACAQMGDYPAALRHLDATASHAPDSLAMTAMAQSVVTLDAWYEGARSNRATGSDSLARAILSAGDQLIARFPDHPRAADVTWRQSQLAIAHGWDERATSDLARMVTRHGGDARAPRAGLQRGEAFFRMSRFDEAGAAFVAALTVARQQHRDSLARQAERALPVCAFRAAEAAVVADSNTFALHAERFEHVASAWPTYEYAPLSQYRAALAWQRAGRPRDAVRTLQTLLERHPRCEYAREARLQVARTLEGMNASGEAAQAYLTFARAETDRESAGAAWLRAAELLAVAGRMDGADSLRVEYISRYPADVEAAMAIMESFARRDLARVGAGHPVSALLDGPASVRRPVAPPRSHLAGYLRRANAHPALASRELIAHVRFLWGEEAREACGAVRLTQPLGKSVAARKALLDTLLARYRRCTDLAVPEWAHASAFRMGESLQDFAAALENSDAPADLAGDDLLAYRGVLADKARPFAVRGQDVWTELLRQHPLAEPEDIWLAQARESLHQKLASRFLFHPEVEFPLVEVSGPSRGIAQREGASR